jgi:hypothetical protein
VFADPVTQEKAMNPEVAAPQTTPPDAPIEQGPPSEEERELFARIDRILASLEPPPLMTTPPEVLEWAEKHVPRFSELTPEGREMTLENFNLQFYHGGNSVLTWRSPRGLAVLATGMERIARVLDHLSQEQCYQVLTQYPHPWW